MVWDKKGYGCFFNFHDSSNVFLQSRLWHHVIFSGDGNIITLSFSNACVFIETLESTVLQNTGFTSNIVWPLWRYRSILKKNKINIIIPHKSNLTSVVGMCKPGIQLNRQNLEAQSMIAAQVNLFSLYIAFLKDVFKPYHFFNGKRCFNFA